MNKQKRLKVAVIGTGIAGLSAAWLLNQRHDIVVFEKASWAGGHSNTVNVHMEEKLIPVDTGFIVYNEPNYKNLAELFRHLNVLTQPSEMSFSASLRNGTNEYSGSNLNGLFGQRKNLIKPRFWYMMYDLFRFYREAPLLLYDNQDNELSIGEYLFKNNYGEPFINDHLLPMGSAIWSTSTQKITDFPALAFVRFMSSHGLLNVSNRPQWRTVVGGSQQYVRAITKSFLDKIRFVGVKFVRRLSDKVIITDLRGQNEQFDHVVIATHADDAFELLTDPDKKEQLLLGKWYYSKNRAVLHTDESFMPKRKRVWSSWNFIDNEKFQTEPLTCVTYWMNLLQNLNTKQPFFVTLNPRFEPASGTVIREFDYTHPYFDQYSLSIQPNLWELQGRRRTWYCGSYFGFGFHEDALQAGLSVAEQLGGAMRPWSLNDDSNRIWVGTNNRVAA